MFLQSSGDDKDYTVFLYVRVGSARAFRTVEGKASRSDQRYLLSKDHHFNTLLSFHDPLSLAPANRIS
jgi:hypothetical protein